MGCKAAALAYHRAVSCPGLLPVGIPTTAAAVVSSPTRTYVRTCTERGRRRVRDTAPGLRIFVAARRGCERESIIVGVPGVYVLDYPENHAT